jgi:hypothetical protein
LRADAFFYGDVPSFATPTYANDAAIIASMNASLDETDEYESFYKYFHCEER